MTDITDPEVFRGLKHECTREDCHVPDFIASLSDRDDIHLIHMKLDALVEIVGAAHRQIDEIKTEMSPFIETISNHPMVKMILKQAGGELA